MCRARRRLRRALTATALCAGLALPAHGAPALRGAHVTSPSTVCVVFASPLGAGETPAVRIADVRAPDVPLTQTRVERAGEAQVLVTVAEPVSKAESYLVSVHGVPGAVTARPSQWGLLLSMVLAAALINNFVFTRYLGLCVFFGVSRKRDTAIGMGITFSLVMLATGMLSWGIYTYVLRPLHLLFLQVVVFIGLVAFLVQMLDTILKKVQPGLHRRLGIYLVLITTNCIILAVPLLNAQTNAGPLEAAALSLGSGLGFAAALFLMSCAREKADLARVPRPFQGLPVAFALAGLFALAFMGFSGLDLLR